MRYHFAFPSISQGLRGHNWLGSISAKVSQYAGRTHRNYISPSASAPFLVHLLPHTASISAETALIYFFF
jgi:hypothetical protein